MCICIESTGVADFRTSVAMGRGGPQDQMRPPLPSCFTSADFPQALAPHSLVWCHQGNGIKICIKNILFRFLSACTRAGHLRRQEAAGHTESAARRQRLMNSGIVSILVCLGPPPTEWCRPHSRWAVGPLVKLIENLPHRHTQRFVSMVSLKLTKLTVRK